MPNQQLAHVDEQGGPPVVLALRPLRGTSPQPWEIRLDAESVTVTSPEGRTVMMLPRVEAARHLRFGYDLMRGRFVSFVLAEGLRAQQFSCALAELQTLLGWLPHKSENEQAQEVRRNGAALILAGTAGLLLPSVFDLLPGALLILAGLSAMLRGIRLFYGVNGLALLVAALWFLVGNVIASAPPSLEMHASTTGAGAALLLWSIQQFSLLGPRHRLSAARSHLTQTSFEGTALVSPLVRLVAKTALLLAIPLVLHAAAIVVGHLTRPAENSWPQAILYAAPALALVGSAAVIWFRRRPAYGEAKLTAQLILVVSVLYATGWGVCLAHGTPGFPGGVLTEALHLLTRLYVWIPIVCGVVLLNAWFSRRMDRELQHEPE